MKTTKKMQDEYSNIHYLFKEGFRWYHNKADNVWYLNIIGHRISKIVRSGWGYDAHCPSGLIATRQTLAGAKAAAVAALKAWLLHCVCYAEKDPVDE